MNRIKKIIELRSESEETKLKRFFEELTDQTKDQIKKLKKENQTSQNTFDEAKEKSELKIKELEAEIEELFLNVDSEQIKKPKERKEYAKDFIVEWHDKINQIQLENKKIELAKETFEKALENNQMMLLNHNSFLEELR